MSVDPLPEIALNFKEPSGRRELVHVGVLSTVECEVASKKQTQKMKRTCNFCKFSTIYRFEINIYYGFRQECVCFCSVLITQVTRFCVAGSYCNSPFSLLNKACKARSICRPWRAAPCEFLAPRCRFR